MYKLVTLDCWERTDVMLGYEQNDPLDFSRLSTLLFASNVEIIVSHDTAIYKPMFGWNTVFITLDSWGITDMLIMDKIMSLISLDYAPLY